MEGDDLEPRVRALEGEVRDIRARLNASEQDAAAARILAGAADRDVGEIRGELRDFRRATVASFNAVREDLVDLRQDVNDLRTEMRSGFEETRSGFEEVRTEMRSGLEGVRTEMRSGLDEVRTEMRSTFATGQQQIVGMLQTLIDRRAE